VRGAHRCHLLSQCSLPPPLYRRHNAAMLGPSVSSKAAQHSPMPHAPYRPAQLLLIALRRSLASLPRCALRAVAALRDAGAKQHAAKPCVRASLPCRNSQASLRLGSRLVSPSSMHRCGALACLLAPRGHRATPPPFSSVARTTEYGQTFFRRRLHANPCRSHPRYRLRCACACYQALDATMSRLMTSSTYLS
jgi:hypothetical protein